MSRRFWVVFLVVLVLVVGLPALGVWWWLASNQSSLSRPVAAPSPVERPRPDAPLDRTEEEVLGLAFWKHRPSRAELDAIADRLLAPDGPTELAIDDNGKAWAPDAADGKGGARHVVVRRPKEGGRPAVLGEMYERLTAHVNREEYKRRFEEFNKK